MTQTATLEPALEIKEQLAELAEKHRGLLVHTALQFCKASDDAEDAVQNAIVYCLENLHKYDPAKGTLKSWVVQAVEWRALNTNRTYSSVGYIEDMRIRDRDSDEEGELPVEISTDPGQKCEVQLAVRKALSQLGDVERDIAEAVLMGGLTMQEYADEEGIGRGHTRSTSKSKRDIAVSRSRWIPTGICSLVRTRSGSTN